MDKRTLQSIVQSDLKLEYETARRLQANLAAARNQLARELKSNPDNLSRQRLARVLDEYLGPLAIQTAQDLPLDKALDRGYIEGLEIAGIEAQVPKSSNFWAFTPVLPVNALALEQAKAAAQIIKVTDELKEVILRRVQVATARGAGTEEILQDILGVGLKGTKGRDGVFRKASVRAETIGRTISNEIINRGALTTYEQLALEVPQANFRKVWQTVSDNRTSDRCKSLQGQIRNLEDFFQAADGWFGLYPPSHPNCRSRITTISARYSPEWESKFPAQQFAAKRLNSPTEYLGPL